MTHPRDVTILEFEGYLLGLLRTIFSLLVASYHLFYPATALGVYPVFGFYVLSGYLITRVMHESYGYSSRGRYLFAVNRFLRLYPPYWASAILSFILIVVLGGEFVRGYNNAIFLPKTPVAFFQNFLLAFVDWLPGNVVPRLVPPTWTLTVEIFFYGLMGLGISKNFSRVKIWFSFSVLYVLASYAVGLSWAERYAPFIAASLPFSVGAGIYFLAQYTFEAQFPSKIPPALLFVLLSINGLVFLRVDINTPLGEVGFYLNLVLCALLIYGLAKGGKIFPMSEALDRQIGNFSYPIYLLHWSAGMMAGYFLRPLGGELSAHRFVYFFVAGGLLFLLSWMFIFVLEKPIQKIREKVKDSLRV